MWCAVREFWSVMGMPSGAGDRVMGTCSHAPAPGPLLQMIVRQFSDSPRRPGRVTSLSPTRTWGTIEGWVRFRRMTRDQTTDLLARVRDVLPGVRRDLESLVRIESVSADPDRADEVRRSAEAVRELFA